MSDIDNVLSRAAVKVPVGSVRSTQVLVDDLAAVLRQVAAERDVLLSIVADLATAAGFDECVFCPAETGLHDDHDDACPYLRARAFLASRETQ